MKLHVRKCLDIVCEIQRALFVRQLAMFLNGDKMMKVFKLRLHLFYRGTQRPFSGKYLFGAL